MAQQLQDGRLRGWERFVEVVRNLQPQGAPRRSPLTYGAWAVFLLVVLGFWFGSSTRGSLIGTGSHVHYCGTDYYAPGGSYVPWDLSKVQEWAATSDTPLVQAGSSAWFNGRPFLANVDPATGRQPDGSCPADLWVQTPANGYVGYVPYSQQVLNAG